MCNTVIRYIYSIIFAAIAVCEVAAQRTCDNDFVVRWALPHVSVAHVRTEPRHGAELSTQVLMGNPVMLTDSINAEWWAVELPDGYTGYVIANSLTCMTPIQMNDWRESRRVIVTSPVEIKAYCDTVGRKTVLCDLVPGDILVAATPGSHYWQPIMLPDGRSGYVPSAFVASLDEWWRRMFDSRRLIAMAEASMGTPYLWGGLSPKGMDCSGLVKMVYFDAGYVLPRDASQQALVGEPVEVASLQRGDLLFFGNKTTGRINHVALYDDMGEYVESAGRVRRSRLADADNFFFARRMAPHCGVVDAIRHPWYFNIK